MKTSIMKMVGKTVKDITISPSGFVTIHFSKKRKIVIPYNPIFDQTGNYYSLAEVKLKSE